MAKKTARDPGAPKRNVSAYLLYQNAMREQFKAINPGMTFGQLAKYTSAMYSELPPSEKEAWAARAEADKARYLHELASYVPPPGFGPRGDAVPSSNDSVKNGRRGKPEKDSNAPKRSMSAYLLYQNAMREHFKRENPGMTFGQLAKYTSHMYKNLTPAERALWDSRASQDKSRYEAEIAHYIPPPGHDARGVLIDDQRPRKRSKRAPKDPAAPKRASGAYVFLTNEIRPQIQQEYPGIKFTELGKVLGQRWRALSPQERKRYEDMAAQDKIRFQLEMQQYTANQVAAAPPQPIPNSEQYYQDPSELARGYEAYTGHDLYGNQQMQMGHQFHQA
jgi:high mobility group protein B2